MGDVWSVFYVIYVLVGDINPDSTHTSVCATYRSEHIKYIIFHLDCSYQKLNMYVSETSCR